MVTQYVDISKHSLFIRWRAVLDRPPLPRFAPLVIRSARNATRFGQRGSALSFSSLARLAAAFWAYHGLALTCGPDSDLLKLLGGFGGCGKPPDSGQYTCADLSLRQYRPTLPRLAPLPLKSAAPVRGTAGALARRT
jgi:hypothetical protein